MLRQMQWRTKHSTEIRNIGNLYNGYDHWTMRLEDYYSVDIVVGNSKHIIHTQFSLNSLTECHRHKVLTSEHPIHHWWFLSTSN